MSKVHGFKGYNKDLQCRGYQYEIGKTYEHEGEAVTCESGFHFCEYPLDVFGYYPPADSRYTEVVGEGCADNSGQNDTKVCASKLTIGAEIGIPGIVKASIEYIKSRIDTNKEEKQEGNHSAATNTGDHSAATNTGDRSAATNTGDCSAATNTGDRSAATNTGYRSAATNTGDWSAATNTGDWSAATNTGYRSAATNTGNRSAASVSGKESVAMAIGYDSKAKGVLGCWIVLGEQKQDDEYNWHLVDVQCFKVDGEKIKADTFYKLKDGQPMEAEE